MILSRTLLSRFTEMEKQYEKTDFTVFTGTLFGDYSDPNDLQPILPKSFELKINVLPSIMRSLFFSRRG